MMQQFSMHYITFYDRISLGSDAQGEGKDTPIRSKVRYVFLKVFMVIITTDTTVCSKIKTANHLNINHVSRFKESNS